MTETTEWVRINFSVSWKDKKRRIRTRNDFVMVPRFSTNEAIEITVKNAVASRHPNTLIAGWCVA